MYGTLSGADSKSANENDASNGVYRYNRNLSFRNRIKELTVVATFDLFQNQSTYISRVKWTPYAFIGLTAFLHNPQAKAPQFEVDGVTPLPQAGKWVDLQPLGTEGQYADLDNTDVNSGIKKYHKFPNCYTIRNWRSLQTKSGYGYSCRNWFQIYVYRLS